MKGRMLKFIIEETDMIDLRKKESEDDVYVLMYNGSEDAAKKAASAIGRKPNIHKGNTWYFRYPTEKDARAAWAKSDEKSFEGKFTYKKLAWKDWKNVTNESIEKETDMIDLREKKTAKNEADEIKFVNKGEKFKSDKADDVEIVDIEKADDKTTVTYKLGSEEKKGDIEDVIKMLNGAEYKAVADKKESVVKETFDGKSIYVTTSNVEYDLIDNIEDYLDDPNKDIKTLKNAKYVKKIDGEDWLVIPKGSRVTINDIYNTYEVTLLDLPYKMSFDFYDIDDSSFKNTGKKEACSKKEDDEEEPTSDVEEKKAKKKEDDGEDSKEEPADDGKDEKKGKKKEDDAEDSNAEGDDAEKQDESVEVTLTEDFHVPGTDIVLEKGDVIKIIPKMNEAKEFNYKDFLKAAKFDEWGEEYLVYKKSECDKLTKYLDSCGFEEVWDCNSMWEVKDATHGKPGYSVYEIDDEDDQNYGEAYAYISVYHPSME